MRVILFPAAVGLGLGSPDSGIPGIARNDPALIVFPRSGVEMPTPRTILITPAVDRALWWDMPDIALTSDHQSLAPVEDCPDPYVQGLLERLGDADPLASLQASVRRISELHGSLDPGRLKTTYAPGKWNGSEILSHLADAELAVGFRLRQILAEPSHVIQPFDQYRWAFRYTWYPADVAVSTFCALREWNLLLFASLHSSDLELVAHHPERGPESVDLIIRSLAGHDLNHFAQLEAIRDAPHGGERRGVRAIPAE